MPWRTCGNAPPRQTPAFPPPLAFVLRRSCVGTPNGVGGCCAPGTTVCGIACCSAGQSCQNGICCNGVVCGTQCCESQRPPVCVCVHAVAAAAGPQTRQWHMAAASPSLCRRSHNKRTGYAQPCLPQATQCAPCPSFSPPLPVGAGPSGTSCGPANQCIGGGGWNPWPWRPPVFG